jgi:predicted nucleotidyltransferase
MRQKSPSKFLEQLRVLVRHEVEFIVVGGVAAVFEGAPIVTLDLDVVYRLSPENVTRLAAALEEIHATYNDPAGRHIVPDANKLSSIKLHLLLTDLGGLDVLRSIADDQSYEDLLARSSEYDVAGMRLRVLNLKAVIESKEFANRDKDRAVLPVLRRTLEMKEAQ